MTPNQLLEALDAIAWSNGALARVIGYSEGTIRGWLRGDRPIPDEIADWLASVAKSHIVNPPPPRKNAA